MKRFYKAAGISGESAPFGVTLDDRPVRTPARSLLEVPTRALARAIAAEWEAQADDIQPRAMPMTGLANAAIDRVAPDSWAFADSLSRFAENELIAYRADAPAALVARQAAVWDPLLVWVRQRYDADFRLVTGLMHYPQPLITLERMTAAYRAFDAFRLAALSQVVTISGSAVIGLAVAEGRLDAAGAWQAGQLDELWQEEQWGKDPLAEAAQRERQGDLAAAVRFLGLLPPP